MLPQHRPPRAAIHDCFRVGVAGRNKTVRKLVSSLTGQRLHRDDAEDRLAMRLPAVTPEGKLELSAVDILGSGE